MKRLYYKIKCWLWLHSKKRKLLAGEICRNIESYQFWRWVEKARRAGTNTRLGERRVNADGTTSVFCKSVGSKSIKKNEAVVFRGYYIDRSVIPHTIKRKRKRGKR